MMADSLGFAADWLEGMLKEGHSFNEALQSFVSHVIEEHSAVIFNGDGYSDAWHREAVRRGLPDLRNTPAAMPELVKPDVIDLFERMQVMNRDELKAREEIYLGQYSKTIHTEAVLCVRMARTDIYPSGLRFQKELAETCLAMKNLKKEAATDTLDRITADLNSLQAATDELETLVNKAERFHGIPEKARNYCATVLPAMDRLREAADRLETEVPGDLWSLPTYQEILFSK